MDEFRSYLRDIKELPDFREDVARASELIGKMRDGDRGAALSLMESTLKYIVAVAANHCGRWKAWHHQEDLVQEANTEVLESIEEYDPAGSSLEAYIRFRSYVAFVRFWNKSKTVHVTDYGRKILKALWRAQAELTTVLDREPTLEELSQRVGMDESDVYSRQAHPGVTMVAIGVEDDENIGGLVNLDSLISTEFDPLQMIDALELREVLVQCLGETNADLLLAYIESKSKGFRALYFQLRGREISAVAARKAKERLVKKLKKCPQAIERFFG